jgi:hypothetical protein
MGKKSRLKRQRRELRARGYEGPSMNREAFRVLRSLHQTIQHHCHENPRRCWEYMVEMIARASGWETETDEARHVADKMTEQDWRKIVEFAQAWLAEVEYAKANRVAFSEPIGELLETLQGTNLHFDQYFTPMEVVRTMNEINLADMDFPRKGGYAYGIDPCCGTGRFMIDALVFNDKLIMGNIDVDLWLQRAAKLNARLLSKWTTLYEKTGPFDATRAGRARFIWGDSLVVDSGFPLNWSLSWYWTPQHWQDDLKIEGFPGNFNQWVDAGKPSRDGRGAPGDLQFDYSMKDSPKKKTKPRRTHDRTPQRSPGRVRRAEGA